MTIVITVILSQLPTSVLAELAEDVIGSEIETSIDDEYVLEDNEPFEEDIEFSEDEAEESKELENYSEDLVEYYSEDPVEYVEDDTWLLETSPYYDWEIDSSKNDFNNVEGDYSSVISPVAVQYPGDINWLTTACNLNNRTCFADPIWEEEVLYWINFARDNFRGLPPLVPCVI